MAGTIIASANNGKYQYYQDAIFTAYVHNSSVSNSFNINGKTNIKSIIIV